jgi:hypothetical protein
MIALADITTADLIAELHRRQDALETELAAMLRWRDPGEVSASCRDLGESTVATVAAAFGLRATDIMGRSQTRKIAKARAVAMAGMHQAGFSLTDIGRFFSRDHTTVLHALKTVKTQALS